MKTPLEFQKMLNEATAAGKDATAGMTDTYPCGGAWVTADGTSELVKLFKKYGLKTGEGANADYIAEDWRMSKSYPKGFSFSCRKNGGYQNMQMHTAENLAYVQVFAMHDIVTGVHTYVD